MSACAPLMEIAASGVAPALRAIDCMAGEMTASAFGRLFGPQGALLPVLTLCLTLYIAGFAFLLLTGRASLGVSSLVPRMFTIGLVLTFATSWIAYSQVLWNLAVAGPDWIAGVLTGAGSGRASTIFADRIDIVFAAIGEAGEAAQAGASAPQAGAGLFQPADIMWLGALLLLLGTAGLLLTARIALAVLMALGPVFMVLGLFAATRGLLAGWLRGVVLAALLPLLVVLGGSITLELLVPVVAALSQGAALGGIAPRAAIALFLIAAVHCALMAIIIRTATTITAGWNPFAATPRMAETPSAGLAGGAGQPAASMPLAAGAPQQAAGAADARARQSALAAIPAPAGDGQVAASSGPVHRSREVITAPMHDRPAPAGVHVLRSRGVGSRFRPRPVRYREKRA